MAIIPKVGRKPLKTRLVIAALYVVLYGRRGLTMVYPFLLMLGIVGGERSRMSTITRSSRSISTTKALFPKYAEDRYAGDIELINQLYGTDFAKIDDVLPPRIDVDLPRSSARRPRTGSDSSQGCRSTTSRQALRVTAQHPASSRTPISEFCRKRFGERHRQAEQDSISKRTRASRPSRPRSSGSRCANGSLTTPPKMREWIAFKKRLPSYFLQADDGRSQLPGVS